ncbi:MAG: MFS transporter [Promethearchaeota archaeon]|jgi:GPH family glycoside/pentoside/hexuronide:cation symporter
MNESQIEGTEKSRHSRLFFASNASYQFTATFLGATQAIFLFAYYETILGLSVWFIVLAMVIFTIYDAINDPIMGFLLDRNTRLTRRWGRRFPWIVIGVAPWCLSVWMLYSAPDVATSSDWSVFFWLLTSLFLFDTFGTLVVVNISALRPDLFRKEGERRTLSGFFAFFDMIAQALGMLIPPLFLGAGGRSDFAFMGALIAVIALVSAVLFLPGMREDKVVIDRYYSSEYKRMGLFKGAKEVYKQKSFIFFFIGILAFHTATNLMTGNAIYLLNFALRWTPDMLTFIFAALLTGALISIPFWRFVVLRRTGDTKKTLSIGGLVLAASLIPLSFVTDFVGFLIVMFIAGFCMGAMWSFFFPVIEANVMDDYVVRTGKNQKGVLAGFSSVLHRLTAFIDELIIAITHTATGFVAGIADYATMAATADDIGLVVFGVQLLAGIVPMIILVIGTLIFWKFYPLTPEKVLENKQKLLELGF